MAKKKKQELTSEELLAEALVREEEWPYAVPGNWVWVRLGSVAEYIQRGKSPKYSDIEQYPVVSQKCIQWSGFDPSIVRFINPDSISTYGEERFIQNGDILWNSTGTGTMGRLNIYNDELKKYKNVVTDSHVTVVRIRNLCKKYIYFYLTSPRIHGEIEKRATGTTNQIELNTSTIVNQFIPLSPLAEQQRIVDRIESLFNKLDQAKELIQEALDSFENRKAAILHQAFTGELTKKWRATHGVGMESWEEKTLKEICRISSGGTPSRKINEYYKGNIEWIKTGEIKWNYLEDSEEKITEEAINNSSAKLFPAGTVLVAMYGQGLTRGRASILNIDATTNQAVCALIPSQAINNVFLYYYFMCNYWKFREMAFGGNQPNFSGTMIAKFEIMLPKLKEQQEIVRILDDLFEKEHAAKDLCDQIDQIDTVKKTILGKAFRGELGTNEAGDESARGLLKEVLK